MVDLPYDFIPIQLSSLCISTLPFQFQFHFALPANKEQTLTIFQHVYISLLRQTAVARSEPKTKEEAFVPTGIKEGKSVQIFETAPLVSSACFGFIERIYSSFVTHNVSFSLFFFFIFSTTHSPFRSTTMPSTDLPCGCEQTAQTDHAFWTVENIVTLQRFCDLVIALSYLSIPIQICYFSKLTHVSRFRYALTHFTVLVVLCAVNHLVTMHTYGSRSHQLLATLTALELLTALLACVTIVTLLPRFFLALAREEFLKKKTREMDRDLRVMKRRVEKGKFVRMLTREIRELLDRNTTLKTTLAELSKLIFLENCGVWMPDELNSVMVLTHELVDRVVMMDGDGGENNLVLIPVSDEEVMEIVAEKGIRVLETDSGLRRMMGRGAGIAVRVPLLKVSDFRRNKEGLSDEGNCHAVLVLLLKEELKRGWNSEELEIVEVVVNQVAVALSHVAVVEESMLVKEKLLEHNVAVRNATEMALKANAAKGAFQEVMGKELIKPSRKINAILSILQFEKFETEQQKAIVNTMVKGGELLSALIEDAVRAAGVGYFSGKLKSCTFSFLSMLQEVIEVSKLLCAACGLGFDFQVSGEVPDLVIGDERRIVQIVLFMIVKVSSSGEGGTVVLNVGTETGPRYMLNSIKFTRKRLMPKDLRFQVSRRNAREDGLRTFLLDQENYGGDDMMRGPKFRMCEQLAKLMHGSFSVSTMAVGLDRSMKLKIRLQIPNSEQDLIQPRVTDPETACCLLKGMDILLLDNDRLNQFIMTKLLEKLGCQLAVTTSWEQCLELYLEGHESQLLLIDLGMLEEHGAEVVR